PTDVLLVVNEGPAIDPLLDSDARLAETFASRMPTVAVGGISLVLPPSGRQETVAGLLRRAAPSAVGAATDIRASAVRAGFRPEAVAPFLERLPRLLDPGPRITYEGLRQHGLDSIISRFVSFRDGRYSAVTYLY